MNEKEAREIINADIIPCGNTLEAYYSGAKGYLEAIEKAKVLIEALEAERLASAECVSGYDGCDSTLGIKCENHARIERIEKAIAKWEREK